MLGNHSIYHLIRYTKDDIMYYITMHVSLFKSKNCFLKEFLILF